MRKKAIKLLGMLIITLLFIPNCVKTTEQSKENSTSAQKITERQMMPFGLVGKVKTYESKNCYPDGKVYYTHSVDFNRQGQVIRWVKQHKSKLYKHQLKRKFDKKGNLRIIRVYVNGKFTEKIVMQYNKKKNSYGWKNYKHGKTDYIVTHFCDKSGKMLKFVISNPNNNKKTIFQHKHNSQGHIIGYDIFNEKNKLTGKAKIETDAIGNGIKEIQLTPSDKIKNIVYIKYTYWK